MRMGSEPPKKLIVRIELVQGLHFAYACRDGEMLVITKNRTMRGRVAKAAVQSALTFKLLEFLSSLVS